MSRQLDLFGGPAPGADVGPAPVGAELLRVADALPPDCRFGTSSWSFPGWRGIVYDRKASTGVLARAGLGAYARHPLLRAVGIDRTYYAPLPAEAFAEYGAQVPDGFRFLVKAAKGCTTPRDFDTREPNPAFLDAAYATEAVVGPCVEGLGKKAGALVFQFPPVGTELRREPERFAERLGAFLGRLPRGPSYAVELRDADLVCRRYFEALAAAGAVHCYSVHPRMPPLAAQREVAGAGGTGPLIARWMLQSGLRYEQARERYAPFSRIVDEDGPSRESLAELCVEATISGRTILITANNKAEGSAPMTVFRLASRVVERLADA